MSEQSSSSSMPVSSTGVPHDADRTEGGNQGEGKVSAARRVNAAASAFAHSGKVQEAVQQATPSSAQEAQELEQAENIGQSRAKEEDPAIARAYQNGKPSHGQDTA
jgi:hypothetical protein